MPDLSKIMKKVARSFIDDMRDVSRMDVAEIADDDQLTDEQIQTIRQRVRDLADHLDTHVETAP